MRSQWQRSTIHVAGYKSKSSALLEYWRLLLLASHVLGGSVKGGVDETEAGRGGRGTRGGF